MRPFHERKKYNDTQLLCQREWLTAAVRHVTVPDHSLFTLECSQTCSA